MPYPAEPTVRPLFPAPRAILTVLALLQAAYQVCFLARGFDFIVARLPIDDAYYYLQVAWNTPRLGFVTFDGIHRTNGLQFLWCWTLILLAGLISSKAALLVACLGACLLFNALCYLPIHHLGESLGRPVFTTLLGLGWFNVNLLSYHWYLSGMENSLHSLIVWSLFAAMVGVIQSPDSRYSRAWIRFSILLVLNVWCRIDAALLSALACGFALWHGRNRLSRRLVCGILLIAASGAILLTAGYYAMGRSWIPVSAVIKGRASTWTLDLFPLLAARGFEMATPVSFLGSPWLLRLSEETRTLWMPLVLGIFVTVCAWAFLRASRLSGDPLWPLWSAAGWASLGQLLLLSGMGTIAIYGVWYQSAFIIFCVLCVAIVGDGAVNWVRRRSPRSVGMLRSAAILASLSYLAFTGAWFLRLFADQSYRDSSFYAKYRLCRWLRENTGPAEVVASFNAGEIAYFAERTVIDLDGLVNDYRFYLDVIRGGLPLREYLRSNRVRYLADYQIPADLRAGSRVLYIHHHSAEHTFEVLDLTPRAPSSPPP